jgi:hypothetical protein
MARNDRIALIASEEEARAARIRFEADIKAITKNYPPQLEPLHSLDQDTAPTIMPPSHETSPLSLPVGQYYPAPPRDTATIASRPQSRMFPYATMSPVPGDPC